MLTHGSGIIDEIEVLLKILSVGDYTPPVAGNLGGPNGAWMMHASKRAIDAPGESEDRNSFLGICEYRNPLWQVPAGRSGHNTGRKVRGCIPGECAYGHYSDAGFACAMGPSRRARGCRNGEATRIAKYGVQAGSINPNLFQDQEYKFGSICNPDPAVRRKAVDHLLASVEIAKELGSRDISLWIADGSNYPGAQSIRKRIGWLEEALKAAHDKLGSWPAAAGRIQAVRACLLSHRHSRLGNGSTPGASRRTAGARSGRYRTSLSVAEHRADRCLADASAAFLADSISTIAVMRTTT